MKATILESTGHLGYQAANCYVTEQKTFDEGYLARLRRGDEETASHFQTYFRRLLRRWLWGKFTWEQAEELLDNAITTAFDRIAKGQPRDAARLPAYVTGICVNLTRIALRPSFNTSGLDPEELQIRDQTRDAETRLLEQERQQEVKKVLNTLGKRDREILVDLFYHEKQRDEVCEKFGVDREVLRLVLFRARKRFQRSWNAKNHGLGVTKT